MDLSPESLFETINAHSNVKAAQRELLQNAKPGVGEYLYNQIREVVGQSYEKALFLAKVGAALKSSSTEAAWGYRCQGVEQRLNGKWIASAKSFESGAALAPKDIAPDFLIPAIDSLARAGKKSQAVEMGSKAYKAALKSKLPNATCGRIANNTANAYAWYDDYDHSTPWYEKAVSHFEQANLDIELASALVGISTSTLGRCEPQKSIEYASKALHLFESHNAQSYSGTAKMNIASGERLLANNDLAIQALLEARDLFEPDEEEAFRVEHDLGLTYLSANLWVEAEASFKIALESRWAKQNLIHRAGCYQGLAESLIGQKQFALAAKAFNTALRLYKKYGDPVWYAECLCASKSHLNTLKPAEKRALKELAEELKKQSHQHTVLRILVLLAKHGDRKALSSASRIVKRVPFGNFQWQISALQANQEKGKRRQQLFDRALEQMWMERLKVKSQSALGAFLGDKYGVINQYIGELLNEDNQNSTEKALSIVRKMRSISLIDEILGTNSQISLEQRTQFENLRAIFHTQNEEGIERTSRRATLLSSQVRQLQKSWFEIAGNFRDRIIDNAEIGETNEAIFVDCDHSQYRVAGSKVLQLPGSKSELESKLRWLHFSLAEPGMNRNVEHSKIVEDILDLSKYIGFDPEFQVICPESVFWSVPWQAFSLDKTVALSLTPGNTAKAPNPKNIKNVVIWYHDAPDIPHVRQEVELIKAVYPEAMVCNTLAEARESLAGGNIDLLHVSCHALYRPSQPAFSAFELADGLLYAAEISRSSTKINCAILASCHAGSMSIAYRNEPDGLSRSILARGASRVIAGQWAIDDQASLIWSKTIYNVIKTATNLDECTNLARQTLAKELPHPYYWSSFATLCGYDLTKTKMDPGT